MKKTFLSVLIIAMTLTMLSSCIINVNHGTYKMYFDNNTNIDVDDWYVKDSDGDNHVKTKNYNPVEAGERKSISDLPEDLYQVWYCYSLSNYDFYFHTNYVDLDEDTVYKLRQDKFVSARNAANTGAESEETVLVLESSDGKEIEVVPCTKEEYERNRFN